MQKNKTKFLTIALLFVFLLSAMPVGAQDGGFTLTILHNNDGESQLLNAGGDNEAFGGVARFATLVNQLRDEAVQAENSGVVLLSSGDNFLASPEFDASLSKGVPFYDSTAVSLLGYDAMAIGNHEFDFGPDVLAQFISGINGAFPLLSANLDFSGEPALQSFVDQGAIAKSVVVEEQGERIGIVGATTPGLASISSPRNVGVNDDVAGAIQAEVDALTADGVNKIILISHLQSIQEDLDLAGGLSGVDVMIAGGGDELLADEGELLVPGDEEPFGPYPLTAVGADGVEVPVVTTPGDYKYVGRLVVEFDDEGKVVSVADDSGLVRVAGADNPDAVESDPEFQAQVVDPVQSYVAGLSENVIATSEVDLEGRRDPGVRTMETNEGNLMADALLWEANRQASSFGANPPDVALQNGGGIRNNNVIPAGPFTELNTFDIAPFSNLVTIVFEIPPAQFKEIMENAVSQIEDAGGRFAQIAGFTMTYDLAGTPQEVDDEGNVLTPGNRVQAITLSDGTAIVQDGAVVEGAPTVNIATIDFLARGGDQYPFRDARFRSLGTSYQQALSNYIVEALGGTISAAQYPEGGEGRLTALGGEASTPAEEGAMTEGEAAIAEGETVAGCENYTVQADDWLSRIAERFLGDILAYPAIAEATNAAAAESGLYTVIDNPDVIEIGQVLCVPSSTEGSAAAGEAEAAEAPASNTVVDVAAADGRFATLVTAIEAAGLAETLSGDGPFTIFAPTDQAFAALPEGTLDELLADIPALTNVLLYHVVEGQVMAADVATLESADTLLGQPLTITVEGDTVKVNDAQVVVTDVEASNGVIHVIDTVLLPPQ